MPNYNYFCSSCDGNHTELRKYDDRNTTAVCPDCGQKDCPLTYDNSKNKDGSGGMVIKGGDTPNFYGTGSRKSQEKEFMYGAIEGSKEALKANKGTSPYSKITMNYTKMEELGLMKRVTEEEKNLKVKAGETIMKVAAKNMTPEEIKRAGTRGDNKGTT